jgi:hypothetical protein
MLVCAQSCAQLSESEVCDAAIMQPSEGETQLCATEIILNEKSCVVQKE